MDSRKLSQSVLSTQEIPELLADDPDPTRESILVVDSVGESREGCCERDFLVIAIRFYDNLDTGRARGTGVVKQSNELARGT